MEPLEQDGGVKALVQIMDENDGMNEKALGAVGALEKLEQSGRESRERLTEKKSVRAELAQSKREAAACAMPAPDMTRKPLEAAL